MNNQVIPVNQDVINLRNLLTVYHSDSIEGYGLYHALLTMEVSENVTNKVMEGLRLKSFTNCISEGYSSRKISCGLFDSQTELGRRQINAVLEVINELQPENLFDNSFGFD